MRRYLPIILGVLFCLIVIAGAYTGAMSQMDSLYAYRSPLHATPPIPGEALGHPLTNQIVFILVDALREDTSLDVGVMPYLNELRQHGAWATMHSQPPSYSAESYTVLFTGAWPELSDGHTINVPYEDVRAWTQDDLFSAAHRSGFYTAVSGYYWFEKMIPVEAVDAGFFTPGEDRVADREVVDAALTWLQEGTYSLILIHLDQVDYAGHHEGGPLDSNWGEAARRVDAFIGEIVAEMDLSMQTLLVVSDHGQIDRGGHGGHEAEVLTEPFILVGAGVKSGGYEDVNMTDVAPTLAVLLGLNIPASSQGRPLLEMLQLTPEQTVNVENALTYQQQLLVETYQSVIGHKVSIEEGDDIVVDSQESLNLARRARLNNERLPRTILALVIALIPLGFMFWKNMLHLPWLMGGGVLYLIIFHLRYSVFDQLTYSLSSIQSPEWLIGYCGITGAIALVVAWLVVMVGAGAFRWEVYRAVGFSLSLTLITIYLLALPFLWSFSLNGLTVTWTLPDFPSAFWGFFSLLQEIVVSVIGLMLMGISALTSILISKRPRHTA